jgi:hypothetical protein
LPFCYASRPNGVFSEYDHGTCHKALKDFVQHLPNGEYDYTNTLSQFLYTLYEKAIEPGSLYFLDKTPRYYLIIPDIVKLFPDAKFIFLFRNPLQIMASHIETWSEGRLRLERHYTDLYRGPKLLVEGYKRLEKISINVQFDNLIRHTEKTINEILDYLDLKYESKMMDNFAKVNLKGHVGDQKGYIRYDRIEPKTIDKWKKVFATKYRKKFAKRYILKLSEKNLKIFGCDRYGLLKAIDELKIQKNIQPFDRMDAFISYIFRICEIPLFMRKIKLYLMNKEPWGIHR